MKYNPFKNWNSKKTANVIAFLSLLAMISVNYYLDDKHYQEQKIHNKEIDSLRFQVNGQTFLPRLKLIGKPVIDFAVFRLGGKILPHFDPLNPPNPEDILQIESEISMSMNLKFINIGSHLAHVIAFLGCDTMSYLPTLYDKLVSQEFDTSGKKLDLNRQILNVPSGDTVEIKFENVLQFVRNESDTLHCLVLYKNDLGNIYDTYIWIPIHVSPVIYEWQPILGSDSLRVVRKPGDVRKIIWITGKPVESFHPYSQSISRNILNYFKQFK